MDGLQEQKTTVGLTPVSQEQVRRLETNRLVIESCSWLTGVKSHVADVGHPPQVSILRMLFLITIVGKNDYLGQHIISGQHSGHFPLVSLINQVFPPQSSQKQENQLKYSN